LLVDQSRDDVADFAGEVTDFAGEQRQLARNRARA